MRRKVTNLDLPQLDINEMKQAKNFRAIEEELKVHIPLEDLLEKFQLNIEQRRAFDVIVNKELVGQPKAFFVDETKRYM